MKKLVRLIAFFLMLTLTCPALAATPTPPPTQIDSTLVEHMPDAPPAQSCLWKPGVQNCGQWDRLHGARQGWPGHPSGP